MGRGWGENANGGFIAEWGKENNKKIYPLFNFSK
jgi:hypothetical protein